MAPPLNSRNLVREGENEKEREKKRERVGGRGSKGEVERGKEVALEPTSPSAT